MASHMSLQSEEKASLEATNQHWKSLQDTELPDDLLNRVLSLEQDFIQFLKPSDVMYDIQGLDDLIIDQIMETESNNRERAVKDFMKEIIKNADMVTQFVFVLEKKGYQRFIDPINLTFPDKGTKFCQEYFEFIIKHLRGELIDELDTLQICGNLYQNGCLELCDKEDIEAVHSRSGRTAACKKLFQIVTRRKANWAFLFIAAIKESHEYVKCKMDPSSTNEDLERAGVDGNSGNPYTSEITEAFRDITRWTAVSGDEQSDDKRNTIEKIVWKKFEIDCSITNLFACHCVFMGNQIVFCDRNVFLVHNLDGNFIREISVITCHWIYGMTVISDDLVAVTYDDCCLIDIININTEKIWKRIKTIDSCFKISHENGLIYAVVKDTMIKVMNMAGKVIRSFSSPSFFISFIKVDKDRLFLTDYHDNILYCCNLQGQVMWKFQGKELKELHGVTTDKHDNVYIAGAFSHNVIVISNTGTHFKELINKSDKVIQPIVIFYDKSNDCLLVCNAKGSVFLFDIIHQSSESVKRTSFLRRTLSDMWSCISPK